jgi:HD-GYP domain-containing protein (c-di-GMP phosphodiesterase class II)
MELTKFIVDRVIPTNRSKKLYTHLAAIINRLIGYGGTYRNEASQALGGDHSIPGTIGTKGMPVLRKIPKVRYPFRIKITLPYLLLALIIAMAGAYIITRIVFDTIEERFTNQLIETRKLTSEWIVQEEEKLLEPLRLIAHTDGLAEAVSEKNAEAIREISFPILLNASIEALEIIDLSGTSLLSLHHRVGGRIEEYDVSSGDKSFQDWDIVKQVINKQFDTIGDKFAGIMSPPWGNYLYISGPIYDQEQEIVGVIVIGDTLDQIANGIREATLSQVTIYDTNGNEITTTFMDSQESIEVEVFEEVFARQDKESYMRHRTAANIAYKEILAPFEVRSGDDVGIIGNSLAETFLVRASNTTRFQIFSFATISFLFIIAAGVFIADRFTRPLIRVVNASSEVAAGNLNVKVTPTGNDEVTDLANSFNQMVLSLQQSKAELIQAHENTIEAYDRTIEGWCKALELRDNVTEGHTQRVTDLTIRIARETGFGEKQLIHIRRGALMHDIGKMAIPDSILKKTGPLSDDEWIEMRKHPIYAYEMLHKIAYLKPALAIPYCHHEKWDGTGYPRGLISEEIPLEARIFAVVDVWDALRSDRPYRKALPFQQVVKLIMEYSGTHFDPYVVDVFLSQMDFILIPDTIAENFSEHKNIIKDKAAM